MLFRSDLLAEVSRDGVVTPEEMAQLTRRFRALDRTIARVHTSLGFARRLMEGDGIDSPWTQQMLRQDRKDRLRVVVRNDDPEPDGPAGMKRAA